MRSARLAVLAPLVALVAAGCSSSSSPSPTASGGKGAGTVVKVVLTNAGCTVAADSAPAGKITFSVTNTGDGAVTELELQRSGRIVAERENIAPGFKTSFSVSPAAGSYSLYCPGGSGPADHPFTVTPKETQP